MIEPDTGVQQVLEWGLGAAIALYGATAYILFTSRNRLEERLEAEMQAMDARIDRDNGKVWEELAAQRRTTQVFNEQVLRDMAKVATREDLAALEARISNTVRTAVRDASS